MKSILTLCLSILSFAVIAQTPIDGLQKRNVDYLETLEEGGYEFRSQIITEFDLENATQDVNIKLSSEFEYIIVALADSNIQNVELEIKPSSKAKMANLPISQGGTGQSFKVSPSKSGRFKISINVKGLSDTTTGFVSFMVLRK